MNMLTVYVSRGVSSTPTTSTYILLYIVYYMYIYTLQVRH